MLTKVSMASTFTSSFVGRKDSHLLSRSTSFAPRKAQRFSAQALSKKELVERVAETTGYNKDDVGVVIEGMIDEITNTVAEGEKVTLFGFGTFECRERKARAGRNPQTGEALQIPASKAPAFSASKAFKDFVKAQNPMP
mmetsp:Transcript_22503/g.31313  ORF Transcript_22503/g.31313 Transcript_22503/m.31313 type:complete len:139 (-) Transcript_22503:259-675(-)